MKNITLRINKYFYLIIVFIYSWKKSIWRPDYPKLCWGGPSGSLPNTKPHFSQEWITLVVCSQDCQPIFKLLIVVLHFIYQFEESDRKIIMAGRLSHVASQIMGGNGVVGRSVASSLRLRSGMGLPVGKHIVPDKPVSCNFSLSQCSDHKLSDGINFKSMWFLMLWLEFRSSLFQEKKNETLGIN